MRVKSRPEFPFLVLLVYPGPSRAVASAGTAELFQGQLVQLAALALLVVALLLVLGSALKHLRSGGRWLPLHRGKATAAEEVLGGGDAVAAERMLVELLDDSGASSARVLWLLCRASLMQGKVGPALEHLERLCVQELTPEQLYTLAMAFQGHGANVPAVRLFEEIHRSHASFRDVALRIERLRHQPSDVPETVQRNLGARYRNVRPLGAGGMAQTYRAHDAERNREVAIKVPSTTLLLNRDLRRRFLREVRTLARLDHPNVTRVLDVSEKAPLYFTMELLEGSDLKERLRQEGPMGEAQLVELLSPVVSALAAIHAEGIIHRDIKPANVFLDEGGRVCLGDFGLVHDDLAETQLTLPGEPIGTMCYAAPEQLEGARPTPALDVYALGVVLYEALSGTLPFPVAGATRKLTEDPAPVREVAPATSPELACLVDDCLKRDPGARPQDGAALLARFELLAGAAPSPEEPARGGSSNEWDTFLERLKALILEELPKLEDRVLLETSLSDSQVNVAVDDFQRARELAANLHPPAGLPRGMARELAELEELLGSRHPLAAQKVQALGQEILRGFELAAEDVLNWMVECFKDRAEVEVDRGWFAPPPIHVGDVTAARKELARIFFGLIENALEAGATRVTLQLDSEEKALVLRVIDNGSGFAPEDRPRALVAPFQDRGEGRGQGLLDISRWCRARGWRIELKEGEPTTFELSISGRPVE